jgi:hypothetical protein
MLDIRSFGAALALSMTLSFSANTQTYHDDSLVVVEILKANELDTITVESVTSSSSGRISLLE